MGLTEKRLLLGEQLGDDYWHSLMVSRRGMTITAAIDEEKAVIGKRSIILVYKLILMNVLSTRSYRYSYLLLFNTGYKKFLHRV